MKVRNLYMAKGLPVFQNKMFSSKEKGIACPQGDIMLVQNLETGFIYNQNFDASLLEYDADYQNEQAYSDVFQVHLTDVLSIIQRYFFGMSIVEVGCGKGCFLERLRHLGYDVTGIDPAYEGDNPNVIKAKFESRLGLHAEAVVLRHVLEHMADPTTFLHGIAEANNGEGKIYIEVPCFDWICQHRAWFDIFYEHVNYFRLSDFNRMFGTVFESGHVFGGQYLYVIADLATIQKSILEQESAFSFPIDFLPKFETVFSLVNKKNKAIWGGASKGVIFALYLQRAGIDVTCVIDINPAKQNKFIAGSGLKVVSPEEGMRQLKPGDDILVMNSNYLLEIKLISSQLYNYISVDQYVF